MFKKTLTISTVVALLTISSMADNGQRGYGRNNGFQMQQENQDCKGNFNRGYGRNNGHHMQQQNQNCRDNFNGLIEEGTIELTDTQKKGLTFLLEEEKVARDVYIYLSDKWGARVFSNIARAEQKHMDAVERLATQASITVPSTLTENGIFLDERLQKMYDDLIVKGEKSLRDAYLVGVLVEETDIDDLEALLDDETIPSVAKQVYSNLLRGSQNHLRAFNRRL